MKKSFIFKSVLAAFAFFASAVLVSCEKTDDDDKKVDENKPAYVYFTYRNVESADMLEYCDIVIEYTDADGTKVDTITTEIWDKNCVKILPCSYTFKKYYTFKADKDMASEDTITIKKRGYKYTYTLYTANGDTYKQGPSVNFAGSTERSTVKKLAESVSQGRFNVTKEFVFDSDGELKYDAQESE